VTSKSSFVALGAMALIVLAGPALAQSIDLSPVQTLLQGIVDPCSKVCLRNFETITGLACAQVGFIWTLRPRALRVHGLPVLPQTLGIRTAG
jgi:hypothetical protein